jgi:hypothetical protein
MIHQTLLPQFSLLAEFFVEKVLVDDLDSRFLMLVNLTPEQQTKFQNRATKFSSAL